MGVNNRLNPVQKATYFLKKIKSGKNEGCTFQVNFKIQVNFSLGNLHF